MDPLRKAESPMPSAARSPSLLAKVIVLVAGLLVTAGVCEVLLRIYLRTHTVYDIEMLRYATLIGIKQAKNKPLRKLTMADVQSVVSANMQQIERLYVPQKTKNTEFLEGPPAEIARKLAEKLRNEVRVL